MKTKLEQKQAELIEHLKTVISDIVDKDYTDVTIKCLESEMAELEKEEENPRTKSLRLLDEWFTETPKEEIAKMIAYYDKMDFNGPTIEEYLSSFGNIHPSDSKQPGKSAEEILAAYIITPDSKREVVTSYQVIHFDDAIKAMKEHRTAGIREELIKFAKWFNKSEKPLIKSTINEYLSKHVDNN